MLRRRQKTPKLARHETPGPGEGRSRRRPRPGVAVPPQLILRETPQAPSPPPARARASRGPERVVLVTGFEPFGGEDANPSWEVCGRMPKEIAGLRVVTLRVPCAFGASIEAVSGAIERHRPELVVCLGLAGGRAQLGVERVAINIDDARIADNAGASPVDAPVVPGGPAAHFATLPVKAMVAAIREAGVPAEVSNTAGTYVCNHLMYGVLHFIATHGFPARAGFIHVPYAESQVLGKPGVPSMAPATMSRGVEAGIAAAARATRDLQVSEGKLD